MVGLAGLCLAAASGCSDGGSDDAGAGASTGSAGTSTNSAGTAGSSGAGSAGASAGGSNSSAGGSSGSAGSSAGTGGTSDNGGSGGVPPADACNPAIVPTPGTQTLRARGTTCGPLGYAEYVPPDYTSHDAWPLIVFFHGDGQKGNGSESSIGTVDDTGLPGQIAANQWDPAQRFVVLSPQMDWDTRTAEMVQSFIAFAKGNYAVDPSRIYLTGLSGGGGPLYMYLDAYQGGEVAAAIPVSAVYTFASQQCGWKHIPVWFFHGSADMTVTPNNSLVPYNDLNACSPPPTVAPRRTVYTGVGHDSWTRTYSLSGMSDALENGSTAYDVSIYDWLLQYQR